MDKKQESARVAETEIKSYAELLIADYGDIEPPRKVGVSRFARNVRDAIDAVNMLKAMSLEEHENG